MSCFLGTPAPQIEKSTIGEQNGELFNEDVNKVKGKKTTRARFQEYRRYDLTGTALKSPQSLACDVGKPAFIQKDDEFLSSLWSSWEASGFQGVFSHLSESSKVPNSVRLATQRIHQLLLLLQRSGENLSAKEAGGKEIDTCSLIPNRSTSVIKAFGVHPQINSFAVAYQDDVVKILSASRLNDFEPILKDKKQNDVTCLAFRPMSSAHIAVGCKSGILFWILDPNTSGVRPGANQHRFLSHAGHHPITSLSWSGDGHLLASGSCADSSVIIWDMFTQRSAALRRYGPGTGFICWSPLQDCLFASTLKDLFRIWDVNNWTCERWSNLNGRCRVACWSPCERYLLFSVENESSLYYLYFQKQQGATGFVSTSSSVAVKCLDFSACTWETDTGDVSIGGTLQSMAWDPTGSRLAIVFKDKQNVNGTQTHIGLFRTALEPVFEILPCGFVTGHPSETPLAISFLPNFNKGALLLVCWSSGMVSQIPLLFYTESITAIPNRELASDRKDYEEFTEFHQSVAE
ncbi:aladin-like [Rhopilema esculentum]|uniref:aladin-like n=1 Tax=Rhopilema esculentum TaxID=499914 RepID=UPI0031E38F2D